MIDTESLKNIVEESKDYLDTKLELTKIQAVEQSSKGVSALLMVLFLGAFALLIFICISLFLGFLAAEYLGSYSKGFGLISIIYIVLLVLVFIFRTKLISLPIQNKVIQEVFREEDEQSYN